MLRGAMAVVVLGSMLGCGGDGGSRGAPDAPDRMQLKGRYVDWDSNDAGSGCEIAGATIRVRGDASRATQTDSDGQFLLDVQTGDLLEVMPPQRSSACSTPPGAYAVPGIMPVGYQIPVGIAHYQPRAFTLARTPTPFDATKAQVVIHLDVLDSTTEVHIFAAGSGTLGHAPPLAFDGSGWAAGSAGHDVYYGDVDVPANGQITVVTGPSSAGTGLYQVEPGTITYVELFAGVRN